MAAISRVRLDASTVCQLKCPSCPTASGEVGKKLGTTFLSAANFAKFLSDNPKIKDIELSNWGEIFLNPELPEILRLAFERNVRLSADNGVNLNLMAPGVGEALIKYKFRRIRCSIDGASQATYSTYRVRGDLNQVIQNIEEINRFKTLYRSVYPQLHWQYIVFDNNIDEILPARALAKQLNMSFGLKLDWGNLYGLSSDSERHRIEYQKELGFASREEFFKKFNRPYLQKTICSQLWLEPQINSDGKVLGCCVNHWADFGNAFADTIERVSAGEKMTYARKMLMGKAAPRADIPCVSCSHYKAIKNTGNWMTEQDILIQNTIQKFPRASRWLLMKLGLRHLFS